MVPHVTTILQRFTTEWAALLQPDAILAACGEVGYLAWRHRVLTPVTTMQLFLLQILNGNTACRHLPHLLGLRFSAAAYCQARARRPQGHVVFADGSCLLGLKRAEGFCFAWGLACPARPA